MKKRNNIKSSQNNKDVFSKINLKFPEHGRIGIQGLIEIEVNDFSQILLCFQKPTAGSIWIDGEDILSYSKEQAEEYRRDKIGLLLKDSRMQLSLNVLENVEYPLWLKNDKQAETKAKKALEDFGLSSLSQKKPFELSKKELQEASLARCIAKQAKVILVEDPYSYLLKRDAELITSLLKEQSKERLVLVFGQKETILDVCDSKIVFENGKLVSNPLAETKQSDYKKPSQKAHLGFKEIVRSLITNLKLSKTLLAFTIFVTSACLALSGVYGSLISYNNSDRIADGILHDKDDFLSIKNNYYIDTNGLSTDCRSFSEEKAAALEKELGYPLLKIVNDQYDEIQFDETIIFEKKTEAGTINIHTYYDNQKYNQALRFCTIDSRDSLPKGYSLLSGRLPSNDKEVRITDFQFDGINEIRSRNNSNYKGLDYQSILGKNLSLVWVKDYVCRNLSIVGVLDTAYDGKDFEQYKNYCLKNKITSEQELSKEADKLESWKQSSYINLFFVSPNTLDSLKNSTYQKWGNYLFLDGRYLQPGTSGVTYINYLSSQNQNNIVLFKDSSFEREDFITRCLSVYLSTIDDTDERKSIHSITVPKRFLGKNAENDYVYTGSAYDFFRNILDIPIHSYAVEHYKEAYENNYFDTVYYTKYYYSSTKQDIPSTIPENDKLSIYESYLADYVISGRPNYASSHTLDEFTSISSSASEILSYYMDIYSDSVFKKRNRTFEKYNSESEQTEKIPFVIAGLTLPRRSNNYYNPIRKKEKLTELFPDSCAVYDSVRTTSESSSKKIKQFAEFLDKDYTPGFKVTFTNSGASIEYRKEKKAIVSKCALILAILFLIASLILQFVLFRTMFFRLSIDAQYQKEMGTPDKEIRKEALLPLLIVSLSSFLISIVLNYLILVIIRASLPSYPLFGFIYPDYIVFLVILGLSLVIAALTSFQPLRKLKSKVHSVTAWY